MSERTDEEATRQHVPVLEREVLEFLAPERGGLFVDCTLGLGGHARGILAAHPQNRLIGIDRDPDALRIAAERLEEFGDRLETVEADYRDVAELLADRPKVDGVLADLGVSSMQLDTPSRGFSFRFEGPLDMRMGTEGITAADVVNEYSESDMQKIFREYGEERHARRIARRIVKRREDAPIRTTTELRDLIHEISRPSYPPRKRIDPATRVFQALRIEVNRELPGIREMLEGAIQRLEQEGRLVVLAYHSLEDRIVKHTFREFARGEVDPVTGASRAETRLIEVMTGKPVRAGSTELASNPRARSAKLRAARRL